MEWIKCSDKMPEKEEDVLVWDGNSVEASFYDLKFKIWRYDRVFNHSEVTHWMRFPVGPKEE